MSLKRKIDRVRKLIVRRQAAQQSFDSVRRQLREAREEEASAIAALELLQQVAQTIQQGVHAKIASVVSRCLASVFEEPYTFHIHFERKRGRTEARLVFQRDGVDFDPMFASGGGVVDIAAFALRVAKLVLETPSPRRVLIMDEPFKFVSVEYRANVARMLETLAEEMQIQFIIVTHDRELQIGKVVKL
jgi:DNA repair exonuclease SbcCD ATPase subunit